MTAFSHNAVSRLQLTASQEMRKVSVVYYVAMDTSVPEVGTVALFRLQDRVGVDMEDMGLLRLPCVGFLVMEHN